MFHETSQPQATTFITTVNKSLMPHCQLFVFTRGPSPRVDLLLMEADSHLMARKMSETRAPSKKCPLGAFVSVALTYLATEFLLLDIKYTCEARWSGLNRVTIVQQEKSGQEHLEESRGPQKGGHRIGKLAENKGRAKVVCKRRGRPGPRSSRHEWRLESVNDWARVPTPPTTVDYGASSSSPFIKIISYCALPERIQILFDWT